MLSDDFIKHILPVSKAPNVFDKDGKLEMDLETMMKHHAEIYSNLSVQKQ